MCVFRYLVREVTLALGISSQTRRIVERLLGVEEARGQLGRLAQDIAAGEAPLVLTRRGRALVVMISVTQYLRLFPAAAKRIQP